MNQIATKCSYFILNPWARGTFKVYAFYMKMSSNFEVNVFGQIYHTRSKYFFASGVFHIEYIFWQDYKAIHSSSRVEGPRVNDIVVNKLRIPWWQEDSLRVCGSLNKYLSAWKIFCHVEFLNRSKGSNVTQMITDILTKKWYCKENH